MKKEIKIALVAITGIVVLFLGMNFLKGMSMLGNEDVYYAEFDDISGLTTSNPIFANGYQVGIVKDIQFDYSGQGHVVVVFSVDEKLRLPAGTQAEMALRMPAVLPFTRKCVSLLEYSCAARSCARARMPEAWCRLSNPSISVISKENGSGMEPSRRLCPGIWNG